MISADDSAPGCGAFKILMYVPCPGLLPSNRNRRAIAILQREGRPWGLGYQLIYTVNAGLKFKRSSSIDQNRVTCSKNASSTMDFVPL
jgi:hypothetical protein